MMLMTRDEMTDEERGGMHSAGVLRRASGNSVSSYQFQVPGNPGFLALYLMLGAGGLSVQPNSPQ